MNISDAILDTTNVTRGRISSRQVFRDFMAFSALYLSCRTNPVHMDDRRVQQESILRQYTAQEVAVFGQTLQLLTDEICRNLVQGNYIDLLGPIHQQLHPKSGPLKQDFTPQSVADLLSQLIANPLELPEQGYFTCMEPACGSGVLCLACAQEVVRQGYNPCEQLVVLASDLDSLCAHMAYIQLSLYGIPAVVVHGDTISLEEYTRWYTPLYVLRNWVWRTPMPFRPGRNKDDELLKMASEPWYAAARCMESLCSRTGQHEASTGR